MLESSGEISPDCRACFKVDELVVDTAHKQAAYLAIYRQFDRRTEALNSEAGQAYLKTETKLLNILEWATFCHGRTDGNCPVEAYLE